MRFAALLAAFTVAYGAGTAALVAFGVIGLAEGVGRTVSVAGAFAVGWLFRGRA